MPLRRRRTCEVAKILDGLELQGILVTDMVVMENLEIGNGNPSGKKLFRLAA